MTHSPLILVVEDDPDCRELMADLLSLSGFASTTAANGKEGLETLKQQGDAICLILLDLMMPIMNGWEFRRAQLEDRAVRHIPVVVLTADVRAEVSAEQLKPVALLAKPFAPDGLLAVIERCCARTSSA
jgi:CheY-like chemotaxis protein